MSTPRAIGALIFGEPAAEAVAIKLSQAALVAPALLQFELASIALKKLRRHPEQREALVAAHRLATRLPIEMVAVDQCAVIKIAEEAGLTAYDASYLWLAHELRAELVTLDAALAAAASRPAMSRR